MNQLPIDIALMDREPFVHYCVRRGHPDVNQYRFSCVCGWWSPWIDEDGEIRVPDHPHRQATVSRTDLTLIPHPAGRAS